MKNRVVLSLVVAVGVALLGVALAAGSEVELDRGLAIESEIERDLQDELRAVTADELGPDALLEADADADSDSENDADVDTEVDADEALAAAVDADADANANADDEAAADSDAGVDADRRRRRRRGRGRRNRRNRWGGGGGDDAPEGSDNNEDGARPAADGDAEGAPRTAPAVGQPSQQPQQQQQQQPQQPQQSQSQPQQPTARVAAAASAAAPAGQARPTLAGEVPKRVVPQTKRFPPAVNKPPTPNAEPYDCFIKQGKCPNFPQYVGKFKDPFTASYTQKQCFARAKWFHSYCGNSDYMPTTAVWGRTGKSYKHQKWHTGDRLQLSIQHNIPALCGKITGSTTVYYGSICPNGNIQWEWMQTLDPPTGFTARQCTWRKAASNDYAWIMQWFGDCTTAPSMVPDLKKLKTSQYPQLKREWFRAGDKVQYEMKTRVRALCAKPEGSRISMKGSICADGKSVQWERIQTLEPREGMSEKECRWNRDTAEKHILKLYMGKCNKLPSDLPELKTTVATELLPNIRRGWFKAGDEVYTTIKTKIGSLCASASGSSTVYKGVICANGNVQWNSMYTKDPRAPYTTTQCAWSREQTTSRKWLDMWLGTCNVPPSGVPQLSSADPGDLPRVLRDRDMCKGRKNPCHKNAACTRVFPSSFTCVCKAGFQGDGVNCGEIDNCAKNPCHKQAFCKKTGPGTHKCECHKGFSGDGVTCTEIDACAENPCDENANCKKTGPGAHVCECHKGYRMQNGKCEEINACALAPCHAQATCSKTGPGTYACTCNKGFIGDGKFCREKNDCDVTPAPCSEYATCKRLGPGKHSCTCKPGYEGDGLTCDEVDGCAEKPCDKHGICTKTGPGKHVCKCIPGYRKKAGFVDTCEEVNNCDKHPCDKNAICKKTGPGLHTCSCKHGFKGDGTTCDEVDACESHPCPLNSLCRKTGPGTFACQCKTGYRHKDNLCVEKDGCASSPCDPRATCHKTGPGAHVCVCAHGYKMLGNKCVEIDACEKNPCNDKSDCIPTGPNKFKCQCKKGFIGDGVTCKEVDACELKPSPCDKHADCTKTGPGTFKCQCHLGYVGSGVQCEEANPCIPNNPCDKNAFCTKTGPGKFQCQCKKGFTKFGESCLEVDACLSHPCDRNAMCDRTGPGQFGCRCKDGFEGNGFTCAEINACLSSPCDKHAYCQRDGPNKFKCLCQRGYKMSLSGVCEEINACNQVPYPCDQHAACTSTGPNAFLCSCKPGWQMNQKQQCEEIDPCASNPCERTAICTAVRSKQRSADGEFRLKAKCSCMPGYRANLEGKCVAVDPCASSPCDMHAVCSKTGLEEFTCTCKPGYVMNAKTQTCDEIDACVSKPCPLNSLCVKTGPALSTCICNAGYKMDKATGLCAEADSCLSGPCGSHAICQKTGPGTHTCNCIPGYVMEGQANCIPDDNLMTRQLKISANEARAKKQLEDELEAQRRKLEMEKLAELAALRQKEELRRFGERLDAFLRQRRVKREFSQDNTIDELQARIDDLEHAAAVLVKNSEQQHNLAKEVLAKKQAEHHVVARKQLIQHKHDIDLLALMKSKVDGMLKLARKDAEGIYKKPNHGYDPNAKPKAAPKPVAPPKPTPAKPAKDLSLFEDESEVAEDVSFLQSDADVEQEQEQQIMVDAQGNPVLPTSPNADLNVALDPIMSVPKSDAEVPAPALAADAAQAAPTAAPRFVVVDDQIDADEEADAAAADEFGSVSPVEQVAELPTEQSIAEAARFAESEAAADSEADTEADAAAEQPSSFTPEMTADAQLSELSVEAELI